VPRLAVRQGNVTANLKRLSQGGHGVGANQVWTKRTILLFILFGFLQSPAFAVEASIDEAGIVFDLPKAWTYETRQERIPSGQLMQAWVRSPMRIRSANAKPGIVALATPVSKDANLVLLTQSRLRGKPFYVKLPDTECMKCVHYKIKLPHGTARATSFERPPGCGEGPTQGSRVSPYACRNVNLIKLKLEPSWAFRLVKDMPWGKMYILLIHALVDGKLVEVTFSYLVEVAETLNGEITQIIGSMRKR
jgi:hypothetical protein